MREKKYWIISWVLLIVLSLGIAIFTRLSYTDFENEVNQLGNTKYTYFLETESRTFELNIENMYDNSDIVIIASFTGNRKYMNQCFLDTVNVNQIIKGNKELLNKQITVYENIELYHDGTEICTAPVSHNMEHNTPMKEDQEYLLFLKYKNYPQSYKEIDIFNELYLYDDTPYSKITLNSKQDENNYIIPNQIIKFSDAQEYDILLTKDNDINKYFDTKNRIIEFINSVSNS